MNKLLPILFLFFVNYNLVAQVTTSSMSNEQIDVKTEVDGNVIASTEMTNFGLTSYDATERSNVFSNVVEVFQASPLTGAFMQRNEFGLYDQTTLNTGLKNGQLRYREISGWSIMDRMRLETDNLIFINSGNWPTIDLDGSSGGKLELMAAGGTGEIFQIGPNPGNATEGELLLKKSNTTKAKLDIFDSAGFLQTYGSNNLGNSGAGFPSGRPDVGYIYIQDDNGAIQAGMIVNEDGDGRIFADVKNFRIPHPQKSGKEIWYASLEGPEAAAYERGTTQLENGRAFVPFSDHFQLVINHETMTVQLTPRHSNTYGLAVVKVTKKGFWVEELMNGNGNFAFDWNATGVRKGHEDYRVIHDVSETVAGSMEEIEAITSPDISEESTGETSNLSTPDTPTQQLATNNFLKTNRPNPFSRSTSIDYQLPEDANNATLIVTDANGKQVQEHQLASGTGTVEIDATNLPKGVYNYSLVLDGQVQETQRMIVQ